MDTAYLRAVALDRSVVCKSSLQSMCICTREKFKNKTINIKKGIRPGCILLPDLLNQLSENTSRCIDDLEGIKVGEKNINSIRYADNTVLKATSQVELQNLATKVEEESKELGIALNENKTECTAVTKKKDLHKCEILVSNKPIKHTKFGYLGVIPTEDVDLKLGHELLTPKTVLLISVQS